MRVLALVDGEHYPPVTRWALDVARDRGYEIVGALLVGGTEKLEPHSLPDLGVPMREAGSDVRSALRSAIDDLAPQGVLDLSDEPVLGYRERMELAGVTLAVGVVYLGADFRLEPPIAGPPLPVATLAVIGTGKRAGKTAIGGELARVADAAGFDPVVVAMGRGGPEEPELAERGSVTVDRLLELRRSGRHAASDYLEDALTSGVTTIGARRAGGGLAGAPFASNVRRAADLAVQRGAGLVILEGSGASVPPIPWDAAALVVPATAPAEYLGGYLGPFRLLLSDLVVFTMASNPDEGFGNLPALTSHVQRIRGDARSIVTDFHPVPLDEVRGRTAFFATTAPGSVASKQVDHLETRFGCRVVGWSARLADRAGLVEDMDSAQDYEVLLTELKAAAVDVACDRALGRGARIVFVDNRATAVRGQGDLSEALRELLATARARFDQRAGDR